MKRTMTGPLNLRHGRQGHALVAFAGPLSNLVVATLVAIPLRLMEADPDTYISVRDNLLLDLAYNVLLTLLLINIVLFVFNLLPIPPLDGWAVVSGIVPAPMARRMHELEIQYASIIPTLFLGLVLILFIGGGSFLSPIINGIALFLLGR